MVGDEVEDDLQAEPVGLIHQDVEVFERPEEGMHICVIGDVVAEVGHGGGVDRGEPEHVYPDLPQVTQPARNAAQIAHAVTVRVQERTRVDLINDTALPPQVSVCDAISPFQGLAALWATMLWTYNSTSCSTLVFLAPLQYPILDGAGGVMPLRVRS